MKHRTNLFRSLRRRTVLWSAASAALLGALSSPGHAATLLQSNTQIDANGNAYFAWEAEHYDSITTRTGDVTWRNFTDSSASGGTALLADDGLGANNGSGPPSGASSNIVTYKLVFTVPGTYSLYWLGRAGGNADHNPVDNQSIAGNVGGNDSFFVPIGFGVDPTKQVNGSGGDYLVRLGSTSTGDNYTTAYQWFEQGGTATGRLDFVVAPDDVADGVVLTLSIGAREDGLLIDRWILSTNTDLFSSTAGDTAAELNAFINAAPIPTPAALPAGVMLLAVAAAARRR